MDISDITDPPHEEGLEPYFNTNPTLAVQPPVTTNGYAYPERPFRRQFEIVDHAYQALPEHLRFPYAAYQNQWNWPTGRPYLGPLPPRMSEHSQLPEHIRAVALVGPRFEGIIRPPINFDPPTTNPMEQARRFRMPRMRREVPARERRQNGHATNISQMLPSLGTFFTIPTSRPWNEGSAAVTMTSNAGIEHRDPSPDTSAATCLICTEEANPSNYRTRLLQPCPSRGCDHTYCGGCVAKMFTMATSNRMSMPPKCCKLIPLHVALPDLSSEEVEAYKNKFEETILAHDGGFYCARKECSAWISGAAVEEAEQVFEAKDITVKAVSMPIVACKQCKTSLCTKCHDENHPSSCCSDRDDGNAKVIQAMGKWGYKQCPKCWNGVRRMYGCSHMQCAWCGAHFCWWCMKSFEMCEREGCASDRGDSDQDDGSDVDGNSDADDEDEEEADDEGDDDDEERSSESSEDDNTEKEDDVVASWPRRVRRRTTSMLSLPVSTLRMVRNFNRGLRQAIRVSNSAGPDSSVESSGTGSRPSTQTPSTGNSASREATPSNGTPDSAATVEASEGNQTSGPSPRRRRSPNLDGHSMAHWEESGLYFGDEPGDSRWDVFNCRHQWSAVKAPRPEIKTRDLRGIEQVNRRLQKKDDAVPSFLREVHQPYLPEMQCHRCWKTIYQKGRSVDNVEQKEPTGNPFLSTLSEEGYEGSAGQDQHYYEIIDERKRLSAGSLKQSLKERLKIRGKQKGAAHLMAMECYYCAFLACEKCADRLGKATTYDAR